MNELTKDAEMQDPWVAYIVVNTGLKMNVGKVASAVGHGIHYLLREYYSEISQLIPTKDRSQLQAFAEWDANFHRKIVVEAKGSELGKVLALDLEMFPVVDAGFSQVEVGDLTAVAFWPMRKSEAPKLLKRLQALKVLKD